MTIKRPPHYEIRVEGAGQQLVGLVPGLRVTTRAPGETIISGPIADQAALHGLLAKVRGLGLTLVAMPGSTRAHPDDPSAWQQR